MESFLFLYLRRKKYISSSLFVYYSSTKSRMSWRSSIVFCIGHVFWLFSKHIRQSLQDFHDKEYQGNICTVVYSNQSYLFWLNRPRGCGVHYLLAFWQILCIHGSVFQTWPSLLRKTMFAGIISLSSSILLSLLSLSLSFLVLYVQWRRYRPGQARLLAGQKWGLPDHLLGKHVELHVKVTKNLLSS